MSETTLFDSILLVEDDESHALLIKRALKEHAAQIVHCADLASTFEYLKTHPQPELIITDLNLPDSRRVQHVQGLQEATKGCPIVVLTSSTSLRDAIEAMKLGAKDFIVKNFDHEFKEVLGVALSRLYATLALEREKTRIQRQIELLQIAIENGRDGFAILDREGAIHYSNSAFRAFAKLCGGVAPALLEIFSPAVTKHQVLVETLKEKLATLAIGAVWHTEVTFQDRKEQAYDLSLSAMGPGEDAGDACVVYVRDISEQKRREKFQREILSTTSHDLKGPLGGVLISSELLMTMLQGQERPRELALRANSLAQSAISLIEEFLSARRIQEGNFILKPESLDPAAVIQETLAEYSTSAAAKRIELKAAECPPCALLADKTGLRRVLANLISNAIKFTPKEGTVSVGGSLRADEFHLQVSDTGSGMEPAEVQRIFERFSRLDRHSDIAGSGIGLFIVKSIVGAHGGRIEVTSRLGHGTTFDLTFPLNPPVNERGELIVLDFA